jgi:DeoR/GlpR family transcriptional regulator of sugar metabolism
VIDDGQAAEVARRYVDVETIDELAAAFGVSITPIRRAIEAAGVPFRRRSHRAAEVDVDELVRLYNAGGILDDLAEGFGVHRNTIRRRLVAAGVELRRRGDGIAIGKRKA